MARERIKEALIPAFITLTVFMGVLFAKGIFPFGALRIDYYDMGQTNAPLYYHIWDFLHGREGLFYSWYIDEGQNLSMGSSIQWNISVFNLFFLFIKRSAVMKSLSVFMGLHLFFMAFNMNLLLKRTVDTPRFYRILFAVAYGLTGFTLTHYTIPTYLDTAALMPLWLITLYDVLKTNRKYSVTRYALMTGYMTGLGYYMAFMNLIFVLLISGTYIFVLCGTEAEPSVNEAGEALSRREAAGRAATRLGIGTFGGIGLSSFMLLPAAMQMMKSSRFNSNLSGGLFETLHDILWAIGADMYYIKWWLLSGSLAAIVILLCGLIRFRKERRQAVFFFLFCMYPCALIVFESINLLWHMGTYYHYPVRCGYLVPIVLLTTAAYYAGRFEKENYVNNNGRKDGRDKADKAGQKGFSYVNYNLTALLIADLVSLALSAGLIWFYLDHEVWQIEELFRAWVIFAAALSALYALIWCVLRRPAYIMPVLMLELVVTAYIGYGQPHFTDRFSSDPEQSGDYVVTAQKLADGLDVTESRTDRIKNPDTTLNTNYGFIMRRATVGGWANTVPRPQMDSAIALGYGAHFMRILDCGGTLLSDAMLHVTETLTSEPSLYSDRAWEKRGEAEGYSLFRNRYTLPFVMKVDRTSVPFDREPAELSFEEASNTLYNALAEGAGADSGEILRDITDEVRKGSYYVNQAKALYLRYGSFDELKVNGKTIPVPDISDPHGSSYPAWFNSNALFLGIYEDEEVEIEGAADTGAGFYELDMQKLGELCESCRDDGQEIKTGRSGLDITLEGEAGQAALIPMAYDTGFRARVNGRKTEVLNVSNLFMAVPLEEGTDHIQLSFTPDGLIPGIAVSFVFLALTVLFSLHPLQTRGADRVSAFILAAVWSVFLVFLYIVPYIAFVIHQIEKRI